MSESMGPTSDVFQAVRRDERKLFHAIISQIDINVLNDRGQNLLHEAIACDNQELAEELVTRGVNINHQDENGQIPLHFAAHHHNAAIAELILKQKGRLDVEDKYGNQPLWTAVFDARGDYRMVKLFLGNGADPLHKNSAGRSPVDFAVQIKDQSLVSLLNSR